MADNTQADRTNIGYRASKGKTFIATLPDTDDCIEWPYGCSANGYGQVGAYGKNLHAHRYSLHIATGVTIDTDLSALHTCHNRRCVNPRHLYWGTTKQNAEDRKADGTHYVGELTNSAKLNTQKVREIRKLLASGMSRADVARRFNVSEYVIYAIREGKTWKHVTAIEAERNKLKESK